MLISESTCRDVMCKSVRGRCLLWNNTASWYPYTSSMDWSSSFHQSASRKNCLIPQKMLHFLILRVCTSLRWTRTTEHCHVLLHQSDLNLTNQIQLHSTTCSGQVMSCLDSQKNRLLLLEFRLPEPHTCHRIHSCLNGIDPDVALMGFFCSYR